MISLLKFACLFALLASSTAHALSAPLDSSQSTPSQMTPSHLRCEYLRNPTGIDAVQPRLSWKVASDERGQSQTAYRLIVSSDADKLTNGDGDLWDSGIVTSDQTLFIRYAGVDLRSGQDCHWKVAVWDANQTTDDSPTWSEPASWSMGLLNDSDWSADYISFRDATPVYTAVDELHLPAAAQYRRDFKAPKTIRRATIYSTALGIYEMHLNGERIGDAYFAPGWTDYRQRAYYDTHDVTEMVKQGDNAIGIWVADGWYSGYVGFGLLTGMGTEKTGRANYGKTPSVMAQLEIEYADGSRQTIGTDGSWKVTTDGPIQEADLLMGEQYDARNEMPGWASSGFDDSNWQPAILAQDNPRHVVQFYQRRNPTQKGGDVKVLPEDRDLGFTRPKLEAFPGEAVRIIQELPSQTVNEFSPGTYIFNLGQNFAGVIRFKVNGPEGHRIKIRYAEMLHPDGRMMTENLRKARATDTYICRGDAEGEIYQPRFTFHGFQYVELSNYPVDHCGAPTVEAVTGLAMHSDTAMVSDFQCSDPMVNQLFSNVVWTQRANFLDLPTDCPQRDERMGWTGDAQAYVATAAYNADIGAFYTKWLRELMESQRPSGVFPGYAPFTFQHGWDFGTAWADAGVICPWTIWQFYGDTDVIDQCWQPMTRFMQWRQDTMVDNLGIVHGNAWGDWLAQGATTPLDFVDTIYAAISYRMMAEMGEATGRDDEAAEYRLQLEKIQSAFARQYLLDDGSLSVQTQSALALALFADLIPQDRRQASAARLAEKLADNGNHMSTGFLGTRPLLPVLSANGQNDLAVFLLQSREFPSWGYEIANGATTIWERWDSYTKEDAFGRHNAAMNSFSHYAFGAVCEWMFADLAGIRRDGPGFKRIRIDPSPPSPNSNTMHDAISWVDASYDSIRGPIKSHWRIVNGMFNLDVQIPANTTATVSILTTDVDSIRESGQRIADHPQVKFIRTEGNRALLDVASGAYQFTAASSVKPASTKLATSIPKDNSINPNEIDLTSAEKLASWDFQIDQQADQWARSRVKIVRQTEGTFVRADGDDPQMELTLDQPIQGRIVVAMRAQPQRGCKVAWFWSDAGSSFNGHDQVERELRPTEKTNEYLFTIDTDQEISKLRFDPFENAGDQYNRPQMLIESISVYQLDPAIENGDAAVE